LRWKYMSLASPFGIEQYISRPVSFQLERIITSRSIWDENTYITRV
jgi:hypothetical protein